MKNIAFIFNRFSGCHNTTHDIHQASRDIWGWNCEYFIPRSIEEAHGIIQSLDPKTFSAVVICGGDGTFNRYLPALVHSKIPCAIYPTGTANDFARELHLKRDFNQLEQLISNQSTTQIDVIEVNGVPFVTVGGIGVGSVLCEKMNQYKKSYSWFRRFNRMLSEQTYSLLTLITLFTDKSYQRKIEVAWGDQRKDLLISSLLICNQTTLGGHIRVCRRAKPNDGLFEVVILASESTMDLVHSLLLTQNDYCMGANEIFSTSDLRLKSLDGKPLRVFGDGEILVSSEVLHFRVKSKGLLVYCANPEYTNPVWKFRQGVPERTAQRSESV